jgi:hypothetical protein
MKETTARYIWKKIGGSVEINNNLPDTLRIYVYVLGRCIYFTSINKKLL